MGNPVNSLKVYRFQIDRIVARDRMRDELARLFAYGTGKDPVAAFNQPWVGSKSKSVTKKRKKRKPSPAKKGEG